jgi:3D-(3,5/4)-trihydroxycyclohexane-1,2-dione acylhydrolase (decyclizing)
MKTIRMTVAQALVAFLDQQYVELDGVETKFVEGIFTIYGHGIVCGIGQAMDENPGDLKLYQGKNEQGMAHAATAFAKQNNRKKIIACSSSIGPGAANMVTAAATATVNNIPLLLFPGDVFASRQPDPVLQQLEQPSNLSITTNDAFRPVCKYWDRITRPEVLMTAMINAMRVLTDPCETGAVCIALCQDVEGESYDYPEAFFEKRVHRIRRQHPIEDDIKDAIKIIGNSKKPLAICGGGVRYSEAGSTLEDFCNDFNIPFAETQAGKSSCKSSSNYCLGGIGVTGNSSANQIAKDADVIIAIGTRLSDFTTASKWLFQNENAKLITINLSSYHAYKMDGIPVIGDARETLKILGLKLKEQGYGSSYSDEIRTAKGEWHTEMQRLTDYSYDDKFEPMIKAGNPDTIPEFVELTGGVLTQTSAIAQIREVIDETAIITGASGSLPGCLQRMWTTDCKDSYHMEYGYSCMGYEIAAAFGVKLAAPNQEVYAMVGDGSFLMLHSEMVTALQENKKINILLFDNCGFGCINNLEMSSGIGNSGTEFRYRDENGNLNGKLMTIDYAKIAEGYGYQAYSATNKEELEAALIASKDQKTGVLIHIKVLPKTMTDGYGAWWHVGLASTSKKQRVQEAYEAKEEQLKEARRY